MKFLRQGIALTILGAGLAATPGLTAQAAPSAPTVDDRSLVQQMKDEATGSVTITKEKSTGKVGFVRAGANGDLLADVDGSAVEKADAYLDRYAAAFGATPSQLKREDRVNKTQVGSTVTYTQEYKGVPVFGSLLRAHVDKDGDLTSVNGFAAPNLTLSVDPRLSAKDAGDRAVASVTADPPGHDGKKATTKGIKAKTTDLAIYRTGSTRGATGENKLAYVVEVTNDRNIRDMVFVDAQTDKLLNRYSLISDGLEREIYEQAFTEANKVYDEGDGDAYPGTLNEDQRNIHDASGEAYWFFKNAFDRDSYDDAGAVMRIVNNDPTIQCPNANWNSTTTNYCNGVTSDDVVAHEWGHAYTEYTHGLIYQYQSGALNESYSDIWGETVDLINGRMDDDEGDITTPRDPEKCSTHSAPTPVVLINSPSSVAKSCEAGAAAFGPQLNGTGITGDVVIGTDDNAGDGSATNACTAITADVSGKIAMVDRGTCGFAVKVKNAQDAGATAVLVGDNVEATPSGMAGTDPSITIPSVRIRLSDRNIIAGALSSGPVNVTMKDASGDREDSYRWLQGEDSTAFGGAIRDLWRPTCYGDPGKVSDVQYYCAPDDGGGVHSNSGVPNHAYALTVDGGTPYAGGPTITGLGLTKAAAVYFRAMSEYQTPTTDFEDHADALKASCLDLVGAPLKELSTDANDSVTSSETLATADCATFDAVAAATELRKEPVQCNFQPMFNQDRPALCDGKGRGAYNVMKETFENGIPADWDSSLQSAFGNEGSPWVASTDAPTGNGDAHPGGVAYGPAPDQGSCNGTTEDFSTADGLVTTIIQMPKGTLKAPKLSFDHYMATETGYDGGNVKYRVNGGKFEVIPTAAYINNGPAGNLATEADGNTNPLAGQPGFTGTDGGSGFGSWGQSQVDLSMLSIAGGDEVEFRFDIGRDGCGGNDGWYVDNVAVSVCKIKTKVDAIHAPQPSTYGKASKVKVSVSPIASTGVVGGAVVLYNGNGKKVDRATLVNGKAVFTLSRKLSPGRRVMTVKYVGNENYLVDSDRAAVTVKKKR